MKDKEIINEVYRLTQQLKNGLEQLEYDRAADLTQDSKNSASTANISVYGSHNGALTVERGGEILCVLEVERFFNYKNAGLAQYKILKDPQVSMEIIVDWIKKTYGIEEFENCITHETTFSHHGRTHELHKMVPHKNTILSHHHESHAAGAFYQSPYQKALIFSFDAGGNDGKFNIYLANRKEGLERLEQVMNPNPDCDPGATPFYDLGFPYATFGEFLGDVRLEPDLNDGNLVYPGKIMSLCSYGEVREDWLPHFIEYYKENAASGEFLAAINRIIGSRIGVIFDRDNRLFEKTAYDIAATSQRAFEDCFLEIARPYIDKFPDLPVCITGGCALNIILNTRVKEEFNKDVFVGPNPNDCGLSSGLMLNFLKPENPIDLTYKGIPLIDDRLGERFNLSSKQVKKIEYSEGELADWAPDAVIGVESVIDDLASGLIVGVVRGNSEHGPRALGNRSILCNPSIPEMKDTLNAKVKNREWYRPFSPVVRLESVSKYFEWEGESRWMNFCPKVREEWREKLAAITHVDGTARLQTVTREQNQWLYDLLTRLEQKTGVDILLNTSFNVNGKPVLSTTSAAFKIFRETELDRLIIEDYYLSK